MLDKTEKIAFSTAEACAAAGIGKTTLFAAIGSGALRSRKLGQKRLILRDDLLAWLRAQPEDQR